MTLEQQISMIKRGITVNMLPSVIPVIGQTPETLSQCVWPPLHYSMADVCRNDLFCMSSGGPFLPGYRQDDVRVKGLMITSQERCVSTSGPFVDFPCSKRTACPYPESDVVLRHGVS